MARTRLTLAQIIGNYRTRGWTPAQVATRTGVSVKTQSAIRTGKTSGATYEESLRRGNRYDRKAPPKEVRPLAEAKAVESLRDLKSKSNAGANVMHRVAYRNDLRKAKETAKARNEKFSVKEFDKLIARMQTERQRKGVSKAEGGAQSQYLYMIGHSDRQGAVES